MSIALVSVIGCGGGQTKGAPEKLVPFTGIVKIDGTPTEGVQIQFLQEAAKFKGSGGSSYAVTDKDGKYKAMYRGEKDGIPPGPYKVIISKMVMPDGKPLPKDMSPTDAGAVESLPPEFSDLEGPGQIVDVPAAGGTRDFDVASVKK